MLGEAYIVLKRFKLKPHRWITDYELTEELRSSLRGHNSKTRSPINDPEFYIEFCQFVRAHAKVPGTVTLGFILGLAR